jgi:hypothetical protein
MNNSFVQEQARKFAARLMRERAGDSDRVARGFLLAFGRPATEEERSRSLEYLAQVRAKAGASPERDRLAWESFARALLLSSEFVYVH